MGLLNDIGGVLTNPAVEALLPTALGAVGGALTSPRLAGSRGALGNAALGGAQGLESGMRTATNAQEIGLRQQELAENIKYRDLMMKQASDALAKQDKSLPTLHQMLISQMASPIGKQLFGETVTPDNINSLDYDSTTKQLEAIDKAHTEFIKSGGQTQIVTGPPTIGPDGKPHITRQLVRKSDGSTLANFDMGVAYERPPVEVMLPVETPEGAVYEPRSEAAGRPVGVRPTAASERPNFKTYSLPDGSTKTIDINSEDPGEDWTPYKAPASTAGKDDPAVKAARAEYDRQVKENTDAGKGVVGGVESALGRIPHPDLPKNFDDYLNSPEGQKAINDYRANIGTLPAHARTGAGLPKGSKDNGDGTWTLPDGRTVRPKGGPSGELASGGL